MNKNYFFMLNINYFLHILRAKSKKNIQFRMQTIDLNRFNVFYINPEQMFEFFDDSIGFLLPY